MTVKLSLDRFEEAFAVCLDENDKEYVFPKDAVALLPGSLFTCEIGEDGLPRNIVFLEDETDAKKAQMKSRLSSLFARNKK